MKQRILRGRLPAVTVTFDDDYSQPIQVAWITIHVDSHDPSMTLRWRVTGREATGNAYNAITRKDLIALMDVLDKFTATLPLVDADKVQQETAA